MTYDPMDVHRIQTHLLKAEQLDACNGAVGVVYVGGRV